MKKLWLLLVVIALGGCKMNNDNDSEVAVTEEVTLTDEEKQNILKTWKRLGIYIRNETDERITITVSDDFMFFGFSRKCVLKSGRAYDGDILTKKGTFEITDFTTSSGTKKPIIMMINSFDIL